MVNTIPIVIAARSYSLSASVIARRGIYARRGNPLYGTFNQRQTFHLYRHPWALHRNEPRIQEKKAILSFWIASFLAITVISFIATWHFPHLQASSSTIEAKI
jgi:UDP-N-acetylmuramyl pentapeptide phosphotransferase/UDP-N-acetylglucosamine-1-phosphate transferase